MIKYIKIRLKPTKEQEVLMLKTIGCSRFAYNWALNRWNEIYNQGSKPSKISIRTEFNNTIKKMPEYQWLNEVSYKAIAQAFENLEDAFNRFFKGNANHPKVKTKKKSRKSFYVRYDYLKFKDGKVHFEKIGKIEYTTNYNIPILKKYINPYCSFDGRYWYLTLGYKVNENQVELTPLSIGIDLGVKDLAICSNGLKFKNINKTSKVRKIKKRIRRLQRQVSRKYLNNKQEDRFIKTQNIIKSEKKINLLYRKLTNIRENHIHQATNKIVKLNPHRIVMEDLNISGMMKNKHLSMAIQEQKFHEFIRQIKYKSEIIGCEFIQVGRFYPSSKMCSCCGNIKKDLKLSDRTYRCEVCGIVIDRDENASINLANYKLV